MDEMKEAISTLLAQVASLTEELKKQKEKVLILEGKNPVVVADKPLSKALTEFDLRQIATLPDCVKNIRPFTGEAAQYPTWIRQAEAIVRDYEVARDKLIYRAVVLHLRSKIEGRADEILISSDVADDDWPEVRKVLASNYEDKRDIATLEYQMSMLVRAKLRNAGHAKGVLEALIGSYRERALRVFIKGLPQEMAGLITVNHPRTLPEAFSIAQELDNVIYTKNLASSTAPTAAPHQSPPVSSGYRSQQITRPAIKMEPATSSQSRTRFPNQGVEGGVKRSPSESTNPFKKAQYLFHVEVPNVSDPNGVDCTPRASEATPNNEQLYKEMSTIAVNERDEGAAQVAPPHPDDLRKTIRKKSGLPWKPSTKTFHPSSNQWLLVETWKPKLKHPSAPERRMPFTPDSTHTQST
ncbi:uncharacterized protein Dwil_GK28103 [Drosophila willistoni]|uniref:Uncharacterized protein n=1 Tax=Drosophila willistoni TaxID=7260 RepID=A0A0Q9X654_DROWI|nr:uncharacterized protein Dwil_GK28103 [Drosophila willistoni]